MKKETLSQRKQVIAIMLIKFTFFLLFQVHIPRSRCDKIMTYFLNSEYSFRSMPCHTCPDIDCLHTPPNISLPLPVQVTVCFRSQPMMYQNHLSSWSSVMGFGTIRTDFIDMEEGVVFGIWETGPWIGMKYRTSDSYAWVAMGENFMQDLQIWRHTCFSIDFETGQAQL